MAKQVKKSNSFQAEHGHPLPLGPSVTKDGINFAIFSKHATHVWLMLFTSGEDKPIAEFALDPETNRTGDVWHILIHGAEEGIRYGYRLDMQPNPNPNIYRFDPAEVLIDPYAKALSGGAVWGTQYHRKGDTKPKISYRKTEVRRRRSLMIENNFDWENDKPLQIPLVDTIIYELHVRGFTQHNSANVKHPGTFLGLTEKIPYLKKLGITAVELLPITEFEETNNNRKNPITKTPLLDFWGYNPINYFAPKAAYAANNDNGYQVTEFKQMVKTFHQAGIEVILDVVFNHSGEGDEKGHTFSFRGIDNPIYYLLDPQTGEYRNYSGCGNTINCNHPVVQDMIVDCLRYWVTEMHVDGFRFDLASILTRGQDGAPLSDPPLVERLATDPILADTKLIAEAWDAAGLYQVGTFPAWQRWAEWNGKFRDDVRRFVKSDPGMAPVLAQRLLGSPDTYGASGRHPYHSINFVTSHDGFTLADLVSYNEKHNHANGENNADGHNENYSWNCGTEGETKSQVINELRTQQMKNFMTLLFISAGVPMITAGDEFGRTQRGNNNTYCQDNEIGWVNWNLTDQNKDLLRFCQGLIQVRKRLWFLRRKSYDILPDVEVKFHGIKLNHPDWSWESRSLAMQIIIKDHPEDEIGDLYLVTNAHWESLTFTLPQLKNSKQWFRIVDTWMKTPYDIVESGKERVIEDQKAYIVAPRSTVILIGKKVTQINEDINNEA